MPRTRSVRQQHPEPSFARCAERRPTHGTCMPRRRLVNSQHRTHLGKGPPPAPPVMILCCSRVTHNGGLFSNRMLMADARDGRHLLATALTKRIGVTSHATRCIHLTRHSAHADCADHGALHTESAFSSSTCLHVMNVYKRFMIVAQPMPRDMRYPLLSCARTTACHEDRDMVIIDDGSFLSSATEIDVVERLHQIGDGACTNLKFFDGQKNTHCHVL